MFLEIRTDLALESSELSKKARNLENDIPGVETTVDDSDSDLVITKVKITTDDASAILNKPMGEYVTIESPYFNDEVEKIDKKIIDKTAEIIKEISHIVKNDSVLVVGLGNNDVTPDALRSKSCR